MSQRLPYHPKAIVVLLLVMLLSMYACIDPFDFPYEDEGGTMVVEGVLTNGKGPFTIRLSTSRSFNTESGSFRPPVTGATVTISDDKGNSERLLEALPGVYQTDPLGIQGVPGNTYTLSIVTEAGINYLSTPQKMPEPVAIQALQLIEDVELRPTSAGVLEEIPGIRATLELQDPPNERNFYLWNWKGTYEVITNPELATPTPKNCCRQCWLTESSQEINLYEDTFTDGKLIQDRELSFIAIDRRKLFNKYVLQVEQLAVTQEAYAFWSGIDDQLSNVGSIFDPAPARLQGNVVNPADPNEQVLGFFMVAAKTVAQRELTANQFALTAPDVAPVNNDCRLLDNASTIRPDYY